MEKEMYSKAIRLALKVDFINSSEELFLYSGAIYSAMKWGKRIDQKNAEIQRVDRSLK